MMQLTFHDKRETIAISLEKDKAEWLIKTLESADVSNEKTLTFAQVKTDFENQFEDFELFWYSKTMQTVKHFGLLLI